MTLNEILAESPQAWLHPYDDCERIADAWRINVAAASEHQRMVRAYRASIDRRRGIASPEDIEAAEGMVLWHEGLFREAAGRVAGYEAQMNKLGILFARESFTAIEVEETQP